MMPFFCQKRSISFWKRSSDGWSIARMCTYAISPFVALSTESRLFSTHSSYLMFVRLVTVAMRNVFAPAPSGVFDTFTGTYSFSVWLRIFQ